MRSQTTARADLAHRIDVLRGRLSDRDFLANKGLGNEAGIYLVCYDPSLELVAQDALAQLAEDCEQGKLCSGPVRVNLKVRNLYDVFLGIADERHILSKIPAMEKRRGEEDTLRQIQNVVTPERYVKAMDWSPHSEGDVLLITGVGEVYPFVRVHDILNNLQTAMRDVPVVVGYPGDFDGGSLSLFERLHDGHYYRAFDLI